MPRPLIEYPGRSPRARVIDVLAIVVSFGVLAGAVHGLELLVSRWVLNELVWVSRDFVWMAPTAYMALLLPVALAAGVVSLITPASWVPRATVFLCSSFAIFGVLLPYSQIARIASLLLAGGAAYQIARTYTLRAASRYRLIAACGAVLVGVLALLLPRLRESAARQALASATSAATSPTNVLFIILDTVRAASMSLYAPTDSTTPHLEQWSKDGIVFDAAYSVAPWTLPSHASLFTGRYAGETPADWKTPLDRADSTLAELFRTRGYATGAFMANMHYTAWDSGLERGFMTYDDYRRSWWQLLRSTAWTQTVMFDELRSARSASAVISSIIHPNLSIDPKHTFDRKIGSEVTSQFLHWQRGVGDRPFFAVLNYFDAHQPYYAPRPFLHFPKTGGTARYKGAIAYLDANIDSILVSLQSQHVLDKTLVIVTADHGELFNEHGLSGHAHDLYRNVLHVPLMMRLPTGVPAGARITTPTSLRDLAATIVDLAGIKDARVPGQSLRTLWFDTLAHGSPALAEVSQAPNVDPTYPTAKGPMKSLMDDTTHYIRNGDGHEELFQFRTDTSESVNLSADRSDVAAHWRQRVDSILAARSPRRR
ncbi:MAG: sulfatase [Gemmatimonadaceae bacterium]